MAAFMIIYMDGAGREHQERFIGTRTDLQKRVDKLQQLRRPEDPPVMWAQLKYRR